MKSGWKHLVLLGGALALLTGGCDESRGAALHAEDAGYDSGSKAHPPVDPLRDGGAKPVADAGGGTDADADSDTDADSDAGTSGCAEGLQDNDGDGSCLATCETAGLSCALHSACADSSGIAACACLLGYTGESCDQCSAGFQDNDGDGFCSRNCVSGGFDCSGHGTCSDETGNAVCHCDPGYQDHDFNLSCKPDCDTAEPCPDKSHCDDASGTATCYCDTGYQDNDDDGSCLPDCATAPPDCGGKGSCDDSSGQVACRCAPGYSGDLCAACAAGYSDGGVGCVADCDWSVFVYLNADNDLGSYAQADLNEMALAGSLAGHLNIVVLYDRYTAGGNALYVVPNGTSVVLDWGEPDMSDWRTLRDFGVWAVESYPARHYALVLWDHGAGWRSTSIGPSSKGFSLDMSSSSGDISIADGDWANALSEIAASTAAGRIDLVGFDACLMGMWEVAAASAPYADTLVASSADVPTSGWNYDAFLQTLRSNPAGTTAEALGAAIVESYYQDSSYSATMALTRLSAIGDLNRAISAFADALMADPDDYGRFESLRANSTMFDTTDFRDLGGFAESVAAASGLPSAVTGAASDLVDRLSEAVIYNRAKSSYEGSHGLAVYFPPRYWTFNPAYRGDGAVWSDATTWDDFLWSFAY